MNLFILKNIFLSRKLRKKFQLSLLLALLNILTIVKMQRIEKGTRQSIDAILRNRLTVFVNVKNGKNS